MGDEDLEVPRSLEVFQDLHDLTNRAMHKILVEWFESALERHPGSLAATALANMTLIVSHEVSWRMLFQPAAEIVPEQITFSEMIEDLIPLVTDDQVTYAMRPFTLTLPLSDLDAITIAYWEKRQWTQSSDRRTSSSRGSSSRRRRSRR